VRVALDPAQLQALQVPPRPTCRASSRQVQQEAPGGRADIGGAEQSVRTIGHRARRADELARMEHQRWPTAAAIRLDEVATRAETPWPSRAAWPLLNGKPVVGFEVTRTQGGQRGGSGAAACAQQLAELKAAHPEIRADPGLRLRRRRWQENFDGSMELLYEGALLAVLVVWLFLRDWRATLVAAAALPLSVIPTFVGMHYFGFTINVVTLLALSLVVGILVDDAIVEVENIERHLRMGKTPVPGRDGSGRRDRPGGDRHHLRADRGVLAHRLHGRRAGQVLQAVRLDGGARGVLPRWWWPGMLTPMMAAYILKRTPTRRRAPTKPTAG